MADNSTLSTMPKVEYVVATDTELRNQLILTGADIKAIGEESELIVGGKNYNTAIINQIPGVQTPHFRAVSALVFHKVLDETQVPANFVNQKVDQAYGKINWNSDEVNRDPEFLKNFVRDLAEEVKKFKSSETDTKVKLRDFINDTVKGFATSQEGIDQLRKHSVMVQTAILSVELPKDIKVAIRKAYLDICREAGTENVPVAVRSSAAGEDSRKKAFAGLQDTYLNISGEDQVVEAYQWDCASAYNLRSMTYRREAILDAHAQAELQNNPSIAENAKEEWAIENTSLSVCIMQMINPVISGTAFSADTATGCRGTDRQDLISIDCSYGLGEAVVGGMVTPDKYFVFQRDDNQEVVIRFMGVKDRKMVYDNAGGTKLVSVESPNFWSLSLAQAEEVARGVRAISKTYGGIIMDTEFCIDQRGSLWFVQARPETRWNEELEKHPHTIFMRRMEVDPKALAQAELIVEGNGASRGAGQGRVRFLRSALELNRISKGDILAAERTDPDMVPGMRMSSAILADVGGDTSHAAITSRELGIPAVIGIQRIGVLRALDGQLVTVDGSRGKVFRGLLPLYEVGGEIDVNKLPATKTKVGLILADVGQALFLSRLRNESDFEIGLLRAEFMLGNVGVHPSALEAYDNGTLPALVEKKMQELDKELTKVVMRYLDLGAATLELNLEEYIKLIAGFEQGGKHEHASATAKHQSEVEKLDDEIEKVLDDHAVSLKMSEYLERAKGRINVIKTSTDLFTHIAVIMGHWDALQSGAKETEEMKQRRIFIMEKADELKDKPLIKRTLKRIEELRASVAKQVGMDREIERISGIVDSIKKQIYTAGYSSGRQLYVQILSQSLAIFAMAFYGKDIVYRTTDYKSNEYRNLLGGVLFETHEDNPMLGYRGVSRQVHDWELESFKLARGIYGGKNLHIMLPFVRTIEEARSMKDYFSKVHDLRSGENGLKIMLMAEIPSNAILAKEFLEEFDGFSIGSNDMTQMVLGTDRDNPRLQHIYDEEDPAVIWALLVTIFTGQKLGKKVGFCGQGVSNSIILRGLVAIAGIVSASVVPDTYKSTKIDMAHVESLNIPVSRLGAWVKEQHLENLHRLLIENDYDFILKKSSTAEEIKEWYDGEIHRLSERLKDNLETKEMFYRQELLAFRRAFHKAVIYSNWDWEKTVVDALRQAGFSSFEEQEEALARQREKKW